MFGSIKDTLLNAIKNYSMYILVTSVFLFLYNTLVRVIATTVFNYILNSRGYADFTMDMVKSIIFDDWITLIYLLLLLVLIAILSFIPLSFTFIMWMKPKVHQTNVFIKSFINILNESISILKLRPFSLILYILIFIPMVNIFQIDTLLSHNLIPLFIITELDNNIVVWAIRAILYLVFLYLNVRLIFVLPILCICQVKSGPQHQLKSGPLFIMY